MAERTPLGITVGSLAVLGPRATIEIARLAESMDYRSLWTVEATGTDAFTLLGAVAAVAPGMGLGTGIVPIQLRTPPLAAMSAATLQGLSPDADVWLGLGVSAPGILRQHGKPGADRPLAMMREYVALVRECLSG
ncbi:MAG: LLM class flavin-dependent oxidoreductase, partial [Gammaproteobacteria bacterium]|nr:LLM class flavin-dependent oxidoreductase [Gammaproteobacteria bacterium]